LTIHGSYWCKFESVADCHCQGPSAPLTTDTKSAQPTFWSYGKTILQNIQTRMTVKNNKLRNPDLLQMMTVTPEDGDRPRQFTDDHKTDGINIEEFDVEDDNANYTENMQYNTLRTHDILMGRSTSIPQSNLPAAHTTSNSFFISSRSVGEAADDTEPNINGETYFRKLHTLKRYLINHLISMMLSGQCFVFLFRQGTERPHQGNVNTRVAIPSTTKEVRN
jgi:hypothetical protein